MLLSLLSKERHGRWLDGLGRQRQQYWWHGLERQRQVSGGSGSLRVLNLLGRGVIVGTHSIRDREIHLLSEAPYPIFAATGLRAVAYAPP